MAKNSAGKVAGKARAEGKAEAAEFGGTVLAEGQLQRRIGGDAPQEQFVPMRGRQRSYVHTVPSLAAPPQVADDKVRMPESSGMRPAHSIAELADEIMRESQEEIVEIRRVGYGFGNDIEVAGYGDDESAADIKKRAAESVARQLHESKSLDYSVDMNEAAKACAPAADYFGLPVEVVTETLAELRAKAMRENTTRSKAKPRALWQNRKGAEAKLSPPEFIAKHYAAEMAAGTLHRGVIAKEDKLLAVKLASWLRTPSHVMPEGVDIPTLPEWNTRQLGKLPALRATLRASPIGRETERLAQAAKRRARTHAGPS